MNDFKCSCPHCGQHIQGDAQWRGRELQCPTCQQTLIVPPSQPAPMVTSPTPACSQVAARPWWELPCWARLIWLVVLGGMTPAILSVGMAVTLFLGPLALVAAPVAGTWLAMVLARHCQQQAPPRRYWIYALSTAAAYGLIALSAMLPGGSTSAGHEPSLGGAQAAVAGGIGILLVLGSSVCWLLGAALAWE